MRWWYSGAATAVIVVAAVSEKLAACNYLCSRTSSWFATSSMGPLLALSDMPRQPDDVRSPGRTQGTRPALGREQRRDAAHHRSAVPAAVAAALELSVATEKTVVAEMQMGFRGQIKSHSAEILVSATSGLTRSSTGAPRSAEVLKDLVLLPYHGHAEFVPEPDKVRPAAKPEGICGDAIHRAFISGKKSPRWEPLGRAVVLDTSGARVRMTHRGLRCDGRALD